MFRLRLAILLALVLAGCSHAVPVHGVVNTTRDTRIERTVGLYFPEETAAMVWKESRYGDTWTFPIGPASVRAVNEAAERIFTRTVPVNTSPQEGVPSTLDGVIETRIEDFLFTIPFLKTSTYTAEITYRFVLYSPKGAPVATWRVTGTGAVHGQIGFEYARWPGTAADRAITDAMEAFITGIDREPEVVHWLHATAPSATPAEG